MRMAISHRHSVIVKGYNPERPRNYRNRYKSSDLLPETKYVSIGNVLRVDYAMTIRDYYTIKILIQFFKLLKSSKFLYKMHIRVERKPK
jgi:hypothetical protein